MEFVLTTPRDFSFVEAVNSHGWKSLLPFVWDADTQILSRTGQVPDGSIERLTIQGGDDCLIVTTTVDVEQSLIERSVRRMLQLDIDIQSFHQYCASHEKLVHVPELRQGRLLRCPNLFEDVVKVIATTNTTWLQTKLMVARIVENFGLPYSVDPQYRAFPLPAQIAAVPFEEFAERARMGYRNASVYKIATGIVDGSLDLECLQDPTIESADLYKRLLKLPGIGPYAASCLMIYLGRYDRVNVDSWARSLVGKELGRPVSDKEAHAFFEEYGDWKALVYHFYKWREDERA